MPELALHVLKKLRLPARFELVSKAIGHDVVKLLSAPDDDIALFKRLSLAAKQSGEGVLVPCWGTTGAGKTTLSMSLSFFLPEDLAETVNYDGPITFEGLNAAISARPNAVSDKRVVPVCIDHREGAPPNEEELAAIKRIARTQSPPLLVLWLETNRDRASSIAERWVSITGKTVVEIPINIKGPDRKTWRDIAIATIEICNALPANEAVELGVDPHRYQTDNFPTLGEFLKQISSDFVNLIADHEASTKRQITLIILFASEALDRGVLSSFTHGSEAGLVDSHALLKSTPDSMIGKRWAGNRGVLTQTIFRLDARAFWLPPAAISAILRRNGPEEVTKVLEKHYNTTPSPTDLNTYLARSDLGRWIAKSETAAYETRGRPAEEAKKAVEDLAKNYGYTGGKDKPLNKAIMSAISDFLKSQSVSVVSSAAEKSLDFCSGIIPDNQIDAGDRMFCVEYVWRSGDALSSARRSEAAQYILEKLNNYAVNLGWLKG